MYFNKIKNFYINKYIISLIKGKKYYLCYNFRYKTLWFRVAKVASRTINQHFLDNSSKNDYIYSSPVNYLPNMYNDFFKFAFVRNPLDRLVSAWYDKVIRQNYFRFPSSEYHKMKKLENFIIWLEKLDIENCDEHIRAQYSLIDINNIDFIGRFENFDKDFKYVAEKINMPLSKIHHKNKKKYINIKDIPYKLKLRINNIYRKDFNIFYNDANFFN